MGVASLVLGILGVLPIPIPFIGTVSAIIGIVLGAVERKNNEAQGKPSGIATAGLVLCIIALVWSLIWALACGTCAACATCGASLI
jgi:hypothetical protein